MINVGLIGCGHWGPKLARTFHELAQARLGGLCDTDPQRLEFMRGLYPDVLCTESIHELLALTELDAVAIATPVATHHELALESLKVGKHVLVEEPMTASSTESRELIEAARPTGRVLCVGHVFLHNKAVEYVRELLENDELGKLHYMDFARTGPGPVSEDAKVLWELGAHDVSIAMDWLGDKPVRVRAGGHSFLENMRADVVFGEMEFAGGVIAHFHLSWIDPRKVRQITLVGSQKMLVFNDLDPNAPIAIHEKRSETPAFADTMAGFQMSAREGDVLIPRVTTGEPLRAQCEHFLECIATNKTPRTDGKNGLEVVEVLERIQVSLDRGGESVEV